MTTGVLLLHGSSGTPDLPRAQLLRDHGYDVVAPRWFHDRISEIPLESFPLDELAARNDRLAVMGLSRGAEAALLLAVHDPRVDAVVALSPSAYAWAWIDGTDQRPPWTWRGEPLPFVRYDLSWRPSDDPPSYVEHYRRSLAKYGAEGRIPIERYRGELLLVAGGDDRVWPSVEFAEELYRARPERTQVVRGDAAGHRPLFPGEPVKVAGQRMARGGSEEADRELGAKAWQDILRVLGG